jgi:peptide/nickel transport system permease protein
MRFFLRRLGSTVAVLWAVATILFFMFRLMPGTPLAAFLDPTMTPEEQQALTHAFGLDRSLWDQYWLFIGNALHGDLGRSFFFQRPVFGIVMSFLPNTLILTLSALILAYVFGVLAGAWLAWKRGSWVEGIGIPVVLATRAAPEFWLGMIMLAIFAFGLGWFPGGGANSAGSVWHSEWARIFSGDFAAHLALPAITLALYLQGLPLMLMRSNMLEVMREEFVVMARMKGLSTWSIVIRHAARNALLPIVTAFALGIGATVGGDVVIETVFSWPGIGRLMVNAVSASDYPLAQGAFLMMAVVLVLMNLIADVLYALVDPRVTHASRA